MQNFRSVRRRRQKNNPLHSSAEQFEARQMLTGLVEVDIQGTNVILSGDADDNTIDINLSAPSVSEMVSGIDGTTVQVTDRAAAFDLGNLRDLRLYLREGNDTVTIHGQRTLSDDIVASLGAGHDSIAITGTADAPIEILNSVRIHGEGGDDVIFVSNVNIGDDLTIKSSRGDDTIAVCDVIVADQTYLASNDGSDGVILGAAEHGNSVIAVGGKGDDTISVASATMEDQLQVVGASGDDTLLIDDVDVQDDNFSEQTIEQSIDNMLDDPEAVDASDLALNPVSDFLFAAVDQVDAEPADNLHNAVDSLLQVFHVDLIELDLEPESQMVAVNDPTPTISVLWDHAVQQAVVNTGPGPTVASRAYAMLHTAMYDAWSAYDDVAVSTQMHDSLQRPADANTDANKMEAMSYAAYRVLDDLFATETDVFDSVMQELGYDPANATFDATTPAGVGNQMAAALLEFRHDDGSNQLGDDEAGDGSAYSDITDYEPSNPVSDSTEIDAWTPEYVPIDADPGAEERVQEFLTPHWGEVVPFALEDGDVYRPPAPEPFLLVDATYDLDAKTITLEDGTVLDIDESLVGTIINPAFIEQTEEVIAYSADLTDEQKLIAEFWEDGGGTSFPPGTFMTFAQFVSARDNNSLDEDVQLFFAMGNAVFDAGIATWEAKAYYDYVRPVRAVRDLGELGWIGEYDDDQGGYVIDAWSPEGGTQSILATDFLTYQTPGSDPSPPFAEYTSGHSAFSAAGATILNLFTGSDDFGASVTFDAGSSRFEPGTTPFTEVTLSWDTFTAAADEAGLSRLYGGIHFTDGDVNGRALGSHVANDVWAKTQQYINGTGA